LFSFGKRNNRNKNAIAFTYHANFIFNADHVNQTLARIAYYGAGSKAEAATGFLGQPLSNINLSTKSAAWNDYGVTYSRVVFEKGAHMVKVGGTLKLLQPLAGAYAYVSHLNYKWPNYDTLSIYNARINYEYSQGIITSKGYSPKTIAADLTQYAKDVLAYKYSVPTVAVDMGAVYEWRPDNKSNYEMNCPGEKRNYDQGLYKLAVGFSIIDFGALRFKRGQYSENFLANVQNWDVRNARFPDGIQSFDDTIRSKFKNEQLNSSYFTIWLPTRFNMYIDYNIAHGLGVNAAAMISADMSPERNMVHQVSTFSITPKYDITWFGVYLPLSVDVMGNISWGATLRIGPLIIGTQDLLGLFAKKYVYNADIHAALKITIPYATAHHKSNVRTKELPCYFKFNG
jgi:hypothetical protein